MVFDPEKISLIVAGAKVTGYADGSKVSAEHNKDAVTPTTGIQGDTVYALNADRSGTIKFTLFGSSASLVRLRRLRRIVRRWLSRYATQTTTAASSSAIRTAAS